MDIGSQEELEQQDQLVVTVVVALEVVEVVDVKETDQMTLAVAEEEAVVPDLEEQVVQEGLEEGLPMQFFYSIMEQMEI